MGMGKGARATGWLMLEARRRRRDNVEKHEDREWLHIDLVA